MSDDGTLKIYLEHIRKYPLLAFENELELARKIQNGDKAAEETMVNANLRLVVKIARKYMTSDFPLMDIIQEGNIGLMTAVKKYQAEFEVRFSTYACWWIRQTISRALNNKKRMIKLPHRKEELLKRIQRACLDLQSEYHRNPSVDEIAAYVMSSAENVTELLGYLTPTYSLDADIEDSEKNTFIDMFIDNTYNPEEALMKEAEFDEAKKYIDNILQSRERDILLERLNFNCSLKPRTLKDIGIGYGISAETVRQIELRSVKKLQKNALKLRSAIS